MSPVRDEEARRAILAHHGELVGGLRSRVAGLAAAVDAGTPHELPRAELVAYLGSEVLTHAAAEEATLYPAAARAGLDAEIGAMVAEHRRLEDMVGELAGTGDPATAAATAQGLEELFARHVAAENDVVLPVLASAEGVSLGGLLSAMQGAYSEARNPSGARPSRTDVQDQLASALSEALVALAQAGDADQACRLAATTWAGVRAGDAALAVRLTALLHRLVRLGARPEPAPSAPPGADGDADLDVRELAPARRHEAIFSAYAALGPAAGFVLVNDHDPKPLRYQLSAEHPGEFTWDYLEAGPRVWRVRIGKAPSPTAA